MRPGTLTPGEFDDMPPHFAMTQDPNADFSWYRSEPGGHWAHGMHPHGYDYERLQREMAIYYGMTSFMDHWIGKTLDRLDELGIAENTLVVFTTDHGHFLGQHGLTHKGPFMYEDLIRLPFLVRWPGRVPAGAHNGTLQGLVDLAPTFLAAAGLDVPGRMQGLNQLSAWANPDQPVREDLINEFRHNPTRVHLRTFVTERYKLTLYREQPYGELFDLVEDPGELRNRFDDPTYAGVKAELLQRFLDAELRREPTRMPRIAGA
jgi:arylsulfatase A-like enzyme